MDADQNLCDLCYARHLTKNALYLCPECEEKMCTGCFEHHNLMKLTKLHEVIKIESFQKLPSSITSITNMCEEHDKRLELYCQDHEKICCLLCIEKAHRLCKGLKPVSDLVKHLKSSTKFVSIEGSLKNSTNNIKAAISDRQNNLQNILKQKENIGTEVKQYSTELIQKIKQLESSTLEQLESVTQTLMSNDNGLLENLEKVKREADTFQDNVEAVKLFASDYQACMALGSLQEEATSIEEKIKSFYEPNLYKRPIVQIDFKKRMLEESSFGNVTVSYEPPLVIFKEESRAQIGFMGQNLTSPGLKHVKCKIFDQFEIPAGQKPTSISGVKICNNEQMIISDASNYRLLVYDKTAQKQSEINLSDRPTAPTETSDRHILVSSVGGVTQINRSTYCLKKIYTCNSVCYGVHCDEGTQNIIWYQTMKGICKMIKTSSNVESTKILPHDRHWVNMVSFKDKLYLTLLNEHKLVCIQQTKLKILWEVKIISPSGLTLDKYGHIFVTSIETNKVIVVSSNGKQQKNLLSESDGLDKPWGISLSKGNLLVSNENGMCFRFSMDYSIQKP